MPACCPPSLRLVVGKHETCTERRRFVWPNAEERKAPENIHGSSGVRPRIGAHVLPRFCIDFWLFLLVICIIGEEVKFFLIFPFHLSPLQQQHSFVSVILLSGGE